jgi:hypothetical protein
VPLVVLSVLVVGCLRQELAELLSWAAGERCMRAMVVERRADRDRAAYHAQRPVIVLEDIRPFTTIGHDGRRRERWDEELSLHLRWHKSDDD